ncbi:ABC transporter ATP-binding protein [Mumia sp. Pv 4-285]|uniref:ABC transporter ATP-binding protein n=1 Tax=Mumia qirimensis TaxID=3234852 RepID=UPI00351D4646
MTTTNGRALVLRDIRVSYGRSVRALRGVDLEVPASGVVALLGANGAGKSTLLRAVSGTLPLHSGAIDSGTITFGGETLRGSDPSVPVRRGIVQVPEGRRVFADMSIDENLRAGELGVRGRSKRATAQAKERVFDLFPRLADRRAQAAGLLSGGEQQMLAMGRALMADPELLLLDEPSLGLAPQMVERIADIIAIINQQGVGVLLVEQNAALALELADHAYVLDVGRVRLQGASSDLAASDEVRRLYLGEIPEELTDDTGAVLAGAAAPLERWIR